MKTKKTKIFGQHFLKNEDVLELEAKITNLANKEVLEIGAGDGRLTKKLLEQRPKKVLAIEIDRELCYQLEKKFKNEISQGRLEIVNEDFLNLDIKKIDIIIGNVPYNISSKIILKLRKIEFEKAILMMQKEFCQRLAAPPATSEYGRISALAQAYFDIEQIAQVSKENFYPKPKVDSQIIMLKRKKTPKLSKNFELVSAALFAHRLADVKNAIKRSRHFFGWTKEEVGEKLKKFKNYDKKVFMLNWQEINQIAKKLVE
ncbi:MAG: 16S rRNA (adenine(1518)-N(6)/adenine(1519)-N(6))-dimethyltransferase RsmA [Candidatus Micrarchaeota archaeon]|nr:16S rRNA (adenine(1518)-N(6)/adenine(1519)-N(6))-dimethyltransferase RsmA [Candidatus Micrarchaeota archaeon]